MLSVLAGIMIALGGTVYLSVSGIPGAFLFSIGLLAVLAFKFELLTGKAGLLATNEIKPIKIIDIWGGNFIGTALIAMLLFYTPVGEEMGTKAAQIIAVRVENGFAINLIYGIMCGILMYIAVTAYGMTNNNPLYAILPVMIFILCGFNHCVADMFYINIGCVDISDYLVLIPTTIGNIVGCNVVPLLLKTKRG